MIMNQFVMYVDEYSDSRKLVKDGITFSNVCIIKIMIDGYDLDEREYFRDSLVYFDELKGSYKKSGRYLIFTCGNGIADDGGWEGVDVVVTDSLVKWSIELGYSIDHFTFDKKEYEQEINSVEKYLNRNSSLILEPSSVIFPEIFSR